jgi:transposase InsO family protein
MRGDAYPIETRAYYMARHESGETLTALSAESGIAREVLSRWWQRYQAGGLDALRPRSRRPHAQPTKTSSRLQRRVLRARRQGLGPARIALTVPVSPATAHRILVDHGVNRLHPPQPKTARRFEKARPGELLHLDVKFLPALRNARYDYEFAAVDDFSREAVAWITTDQNGRTAADFLERVLKTLPYAIEAVLTDNAWVFTMQQAFHATRQTRFQQICHAAGIRHYVLRPYAPQSNGKVERFFRTVDDECLNVQPLFSFAARDRALERFLRYYNHQRPHLSLAGQTPVERREAFFRERRA